MATGVGAGRKAGRAPADADGNVLGRSSLLTDPADVRFLVAGTRLGAVTTVIVCVASLLYCAQTWEQGNRPLLLAFCGVFGAGSIVLLAVPLARLIGGSLARHVLHRLELRLGGGHGAESPPGRGR